MPQHDYVIDNADGATFRADINNALAAIRTQNSGSTAPTSTAPFMLWADTSAGVLRQRNAADTAWVTVMTLAQPAVPAGVVAPFAGSAAPTGWLLCDGSAVSRTTFAALFAAIGTAFGAGDGTTTFNLPDARDRVLVGEGDMGGTHANRMGATLSGTTTAGSAVITGLSSTANLSVGMVAIGANIPAGRTIASIDSATQVTLNSGTSVTAGTGNIRFAVFDTGTVGSAGGAAVHTLTTPQMPAHTHPQTGQNGGTVSAGSFFTAGNYGSVSGQATASTGGGQAHPIVQPSLVVQYIIKT